MANAKVPSSTTNFRIGSLKALKIVKMMEKIAKPPPKISHVFSSMYDFTTGVIMFEPFNPLMSRNQTMLVTAMPPKMPILSEEPRRFPILPV